jgi:hypothetical protein
MGVIYYKDIEYAGGDSGGGGGTTVVANPVAPATGDLSKIQIGTGIYSIVSGGGTLENLYHASAAATVITLNKSVADYDAIILYGYLIQDGYNFYCSSFNLVNTIKNDNDGKIGLGTELFEVWYNLTSNTVLTRVGMRGDWIITDICGVKTAEGGGGEPTIIVDGELSTSSAHPVENRVVTNALNNKADKITTYTKTEIDNALDTKANIDTTYSKVEVNNALNTKADKTTTYTKTEVDEAINSVIVSSLENLDDVNISSPTEGQVLKYNAANETWVNTEDDKGTEVIANPEETATEDLTSIKIDDTVYNIAGGGSGGEGSDVSITPMLSSGVKIADYEIDGVEGEIYVPEVTANEEDTPTEILDSIRINDTVYNVSNFARDDFYVDYSVKLFEDLKTGWADVSEYTAERNCVAYVTTKGTEAFAMLPYIDGVAIPFTRAHPEEFATTILFLRKGQTISKRVLENESGTIHYFIMVYPVRTNISPVIYSEEEREIGTWLDGKPMYQKTVIIPSLPSTINTIVSYNHNIENIDTICSWEGFQKFTNGLCFQISNARLIEGGNVGFDPNSSISGRLSRTSIDIVVGLDRSATSGEFHIRYTKTTDSPGSGLYATTGGTAVHYSTSEQIIGTWIDGKPLYQKTVIIQTLPSTPYTLVEYYHNISNVKEIVDWNGYQRFQSGACYKLGNIQFDMTYAGNLHPTSSTWAGVNKTKIQIVTGMDRSASSGLFHIQYTKTTD